MPLTAFCSAQNVFPLEQKCWWDEKYIGSERVRFDKRFEGGGGGDNPVKIPFERDFYILKISRNKNGRSKV